MKPVFLRTNRWEETHTVNQKWKTTDPRTMPCSGVRCSLTLSRTVQWTRPPATDTSEAGPCSLKMRYKNDCPNDCPLTVQLLPTGYIFSFFQVILRFALQRKRTTSRNVREIPWFTDIMLPGKQNGREMQEITAILQTLQGMFCTNCG